MASPFAAGRGIREGKPPGSDVTPNAETTPSQRNYNANTRRSPHRRPVFASPRQHRRQVFAEGGRRGPGPAGGHGFEAPNHTGEQRAAPCLREPMPPSAEHWRKPVGGAMRSRGNVRRARAALLALAAAVRHPAARPRVDVMLARTIGSNLVKPGRRAVRTPAAAIAVGAVWRFGGEPGQSEDADPRYPSASRVTHSLLILSA